VLASNLSGPAYWDALDEHGDMLAGFWVDPVSQRCYSHWLARPSTIVREKGKLIPPGIFFSFAFSSLSPHSVQFYLPTLGTN